MLFKIKGGEKYIPESDQKAFSHSTSAASPLLNVPSPFSLGFNHRAAIKHVRKDVIDTSQAEWL